MFYFLFIFLFKKKNVFSVMYFILDPVVQRGVPQMRSISFKSNQKPDPILKGSANIQSLHLRWAAFAT